MKRLTKVVSGVISAFTVGGCANVRGAMLENPVVAPAWKAWEAGDLDKALGLGEALVESSATQDEGRHILALIAHLRGEHGVAIAHHARISTGYRWLARLDEPILWSHVHAGDIRGAVALATRRGLPRSTLSRLELARERPLTVRVRGVVTLPFVDDALTPFMPGIEATLCGHRTIARLDTGGTFVHLSAEQADRLGIATVACEETFASLTAGEACFGVAAELELGDATLRNVPVVVHDGALATRGIADALGVEIGPILGTNVVQQFLTTIDGPGRRLVLSPRDDPAARERHLALVEETQGRSHDVPFTLWLDHYMTVRGTMAGRPANWFVDSGLVTINDSQGQAALLASHGALAAWGAAPAAGASLFPELPGAVCVGSACRHGLTAFPVPEATWKAFGDWGGRRIDAMISWGFLSAFSWTIDFDRYVYTLGESPGAASRGG